MVVKVFGGKFLFEVWPVLFSLIPLAVSLVALYFPKGCRGRNIKIGAGINLVVLALCIFLRYFLTDKGVVVEAAFASIMVTIGTFVTYTDCDRFWDYHEYILHKIISTFALLFFWAIVVVSMALLRYDENIVEIEPEIKTITYEIVQEDGEAIADKEEIEQIFEDGSFSIELEEGVKNPKLQKKVIYNYSEDRNEMPPVRILTSTEVEYTLYVSPSKLVLEE